MTSGVSRASLKRTRARHAHSRTPSPAPYGGQEPEPTLIVRLRETVLALSVALTVPTCLVTTGEVVTLKFGLTVVPAGMKTLAGTVTPARLVVERLTVRPPAGAGPVR